LTSLRDEITRAVGGFLDASVHLLTGFASVAKQAAQGAAIVADGLAGGRFAPIVDAMRLRDASGTVLDHLYVIDAAAAKARLGIQ